MLIYVDIPDHIHTIDNIVYVRVISHFRSISNINTVNQTFDAKIWVQLRWMIHKPYDDVDLEHEWYPMLEVANNRGKLTHEQCVLVKKQKKNRLTAVYANYLFQGTFSEQFNLKQFPIDMQQLHINFTMWGFPIVSDDTKKNIQETRFSPKKLKLYTRPDKNLIFKEEFVPYEIWNICSNILFWQGDNKVSRNERRVTYCNMEVSLFISRKTVFYFINIVVPTFIIVASSISSRMLETIESQQSLVYTLMLTIVSLKFATVNFIPKTSIVTYLDMYSLGSFIWVTIAALHNVVMHQLYNFHNYAYSTVFKTDLGIIYWQLGSWIIIHIGIILILSKKIRKYISYHHHHVSSHKRSLVLTERHDKLKHKSPAAAAAAAAELHIHIDDNDNACRECRECREWRERRERRERSSDETNIDAINEIEEEREKQENEREKHEDFPLVAFPHPAKTMALSCMNGSVLDREDTPFFNKTMSQYVSFNRQGMNNNNNILHEECEE